MFVREVSDAKWARLGPRLWRAATVAVLVGAAGVVAAAVAVDSPLVLGIGGSLLVAAALVGEIILIKPDRPRYSIGSETGTPTRLDMTIIPAQPGLRQLVIDQGRFTRLAAVGSALQLAAIIWQGTQ